MVVINDSENVDDDGNSNQIVVEYVSIIINSNIRSAFLRRSTRHLASQPARSREAPPGCLEMRDRRAWGAARMARRRVCPRTATAV